MTHSIANRQATDRLGIRNNRAVDRLGIRSRQAADRLGIRNKAMSTPLTTFPFTYAEASAATYATFDATLRHVAGLNAGLGDPAVSFPVTGIPAADNYMAAVYVPAAGAVYMAPRDAAQVLKITCANDSAATIGTSYGAGLDNWGGGALASDGLIYCAPYNSNDILVIDPTNDTTALIPTGLAGAAKYGSVVATAGAVYFGPRAAAQVMKLRLSDNAISLIPGWTNPGSFGNEWGGCLGPDGRVYFSPMASNGAMLVVDPTTDTATTIGPFLANQYAGGIFPWNGALKVPFLNDVASADFSHMTVTDPAGTPTYAYVSDAWFSGGVAAQAAIGRALMADGRVYGHAYVTAGTADRVDVWDLSNSGAGSSSFLTTDALTTFAYLANGTGPNGLSVYFAPYLETKVMKLTLPAGAVGLPDDLVASAFYNGGGK